MNEWYVIIKLYPQDCLQGERMRMVWLFQFVQSKSDWERVNGEAASSAERGENLIFWEEDKLQVHW